MKKDIKDKEDLRDSRDSGEEKPREPRLPRLLSSAACEKEWERHWTGTVYPLTTLLRILCAQMLAIILFP